MRWVAVTCESLHCAIYSVSHAQKRNQKLLSTVDAVKQQLRSQQFECSVNPLFEVFSIPYFVGSFKSFAKLCLYLFIFYQSHSMLRVMLL